MKEFMLLFRMDILTKKAQPTRAQMEVYMEQWMQWINEISEKGRLAVGGNHLANTGKVLRPKNVMTDEPYTVNKESVSGYIIVYAKEMKGALLIAKECPILNGKGTSVEVREISTPPLT